MGPRIGRVAVLLVVMLGGCSHRLTVPAEQPSTKSVESIEPSPVVTAIPEPTPSTAPYADAEAEVRQLAEAFVRGALEYDTRTETASAFLARVAPLTTQAELHRLRASARAGLEWRVPSDRAERVAITITGVTVAETGQVLVDVERTTTTSFATVRDFVHVALELASVGGSLKVADAAGGGL